GEHSALLFDEEQLVVGFVWRQETEAPEIEAEAVDGTHLEHRVLTGVILILDPAVEGQIERLDAAEVEALAKKGFSSRAKKSFDLPRNTSPGKAGGILKR